MSKVADLVFDFASPIVEKLGFELVEVSYDKTKNGKELSLSIYHKDRPVTIEDCELVSKTLDAPLDELNPTGDESYILSVGSLGLDREIKTDADLNRSLGKELEISLYKMQNKTKNFVGVLESFDRETITIKNEKEKVILARDNIASARLYIKI